MKRINIVCITLLMILLGVNTSCADYLDKAPDEDLTLDDVFTRENYAEQFLSSIYWNMPWELNFTNDWGHNPFVGAADELDYPYTNCFAYFMNNGSWTPDNVLKDISNMAYQGIRKTNIFLENVAKVPMDESKRAGWIGEATFLRAFFHFQLLRIYGPIHITEKVFDPNEDFSELCKRMPLDQCVDFITNECDKAGGMLKMKEGADRYGRVTKAAAMALKARALLYRASPLWNGNPDYANFTDKEGNHLFPLSYEAERWKIAAEYTKTCIDEMEKAGYGLYYAPSGDPMENYRYLFVENWNKEIIFAKNVAIYDQMERAAAPLSLGGWSGLCPTQELVDAYEMADGTTPILGYNADGSPIINSESGYSEEGFTEEADAEGYYPENSFNMFVDREPRFYATVTYSGAYWRGRQIDFRMGAPDGRTGGPDYTTTGYLMRKFLDEDGVDILRGVFVNKTWNYFRLGELYLNYAEALNEASGPVDDVYKYVNLIRKRSGLPGLKAGLSQDEMRQKIRRERQVELALETHRYFDCNRWKISDQVKAVHGMDIGARDNSFFKRTLVEERVFEAPKHYLWPFHQDEVNKNPDIFVQNPGWGGIN